jgi:glyoxylase-like metal-dependent hydrolase (beta-lactamase superfamily II)
MNRREFMKSAAVVAVVYGIPVSLLKELSFAEDRISRANAGWLKAEIKIEPVADGVHMLSGIGGNVGILRTGKSSLLVDTGGHVRTADVLAKNATLGNGAPKVVVNTHYHFDHVDGNENLVKAGCEIVAQENTRKRMSAPQTLEFVGETLPAWPPSALPTRTFADELVLTPEGESVRLVHFADAHTDTDLIVVFEKQNVVHAGDLMFNGFYPVIDFSAKGWIGGQAAGVQKVADLAKGDAKIIPGHGPIATKAQAQAQADMLKKIHERLAKLMEKGSTVADAVAAKPTADLDEQWGKGFFNGDQFTEMAYKGLLRHHGKSFA